MSVLDYMFDNDWLQRDDIENLRRNGMVLRRNEVRNTGRIRNLEAEVDFLTEQLGHMMLINEALLRMLEKKGVTGLATVAIRNKESLCALRPQGSTLLLETLFYPDEIRARDVKLPARLAVGLTRLPTDLAFKTSQTRDSLNQISDQYFAAVAQVHRIAFVVDGCGLNQSFGAILDVEKLARNISRAPGFDERGAAQPGLDAFANQGGNHV